MPKRISPEEGRAWFEEHLRQRRDLGLGKAMANMVLEPRNPFDPRARRRPRVAFVLAASLFAIAVSWFVYFNILR
jgi:hypothetical protein